jgi:hypothetical protein
MAQRLNAHERLCSSQLQAMGYEAALADKYAYHTYGELEKAIDLIERPRAQDDKVCLIPICMLSFAVARAIACAV